MTDERLRELYQRVMARRAAQGGDYPVSPEEMVQVLEGRMGESERQRVLLAIMSDPRSRQEFDLLRAVVAGAERQSSGRPAQATRWLSLAAGLVLFVGAGLAFRVWMRRSTVEPFRAGSESLEVQLLSPAPGMGRAAGLRFVWRSVPRALRYDLNLVTAGGRLIYTATLTDTAATVPDSVRVEPNADLRWWVEATTTDGRQTRSALRPLTINP